MVDNNTFFDKAQLTGIITRASEVIAIPALRHSSAVDSCVGEQRKFVKYLDVLKFFYSCIYSQFLSLLFR